MLKHHPLRKHLDDDYPICKRMEEKKSTHWIPVPPKYWDKVLEYTPQPKDKYHEERHKLP